MKEAGQHMERAEGKLRTHDPRDAEGEEQQALDQLGQMKQQLQNQRRPREQQSGGPRRQRAGQDSRRRRVSRAARSFARICWRR